MNNNVYIQSLEAANIWEHMTRGQYIKHNYKGMIPYSLELIKLRKLKDFNTFTIKDGKKEISKDIINVKFKQKVRTGQELLKDLPGYVNEKENKLDELNKELKQATGKRKVDGLKNKIDKLNKSKERLEDLIKQIEDDKDKPEWQEICADELRKQLYLNGFTITEEDGTGTHYVVYKRSSAKSRTGQCLFIKESLYNEMINWSRLGLQFDEDKPVDLASLLAYESLVGSSLENVIKIDPKHILIVDDVKSSFDEECNVIKMNGEHLESVIEMVKVTNEIFDGQALLHSELFPEGKSMMLLRNHMFKAAAFSTNIQLFMKDYFKDEYETATVTDMFNNKIKVTDIKLIINPSCLKALKFSHVVGEESDMWEWWKVKVKEDDNLFGICKYDKSTKHIINGQFMRETSYQMLNSLPADKGSIEKLSEFERNYINDLKNDDETFIQYIEENKNQVNANEMFVELYKRNKDIVRTKAFREFRSKTISNYVKHIKKGKLRLNGDYATLLSCPVEYLNHAVGEKITEPLTLIGNQVYTTMFEFDKDYVAFRNPHTSQSNVLIVRNTYSEKIEKYFELTPNVVVINTISFNILNILSGADMDSDTMVIFKNDDLKNLAKECFGKYRVCVNEIKSDKTEYHLTFEDMYKIDLKLSQSQRQIGEVVNLGQLALSLYYDKLNDKKENDEELLKIVDIMTILSGSAIDGAKRQYVVDIDKEIKFVRKQLELKKKKVEIEGGIDYVSAKPNFWRFVTDKKNKSKCNYVSYDCSMDKLFAVMDEIDDAEGKKSLELSSLLIVKDKNKATRRQIPKADELANELQQKIAEIKTKGGDEEEVNIQLEDVTEEYTNMFGKLKINENTMYAILLTIDCKDKGKKDNGKNKSTVRLLNQLYKTRTDIFLNAFKQLN